MLSSKCCMSLCRWPPCSWPMTYWKEGFWGLVWNGCNGRNWEILSHMIIWVRLQHLIVWSSNSHKLYFLLSCDRTIYLCAQPFNFASIVAFVPKHFYIVQHKVLKIRFSRFHNYLSSSFTGLPTLNYWIFWIDCSKVFIRPFRCKHEIRHKIRF